MEEVTDTIHWGEGSCCAIRHYSPLEEQMDGAQDVAAVKLVPVDLPKNNEGLHDNSGLEPFDEGWEDSPPKQVRGGACVLLSAWNTV